MNGLQVTSVVLAIACLALSLFAIWQRWDKDGK